MGLDMSPTASGRGGSGPCSLSGTPTTLNALTRAFIRRVCVGLNFANQVIFINIATALWALDIRKARDAHGHEITPDPNALVDAGVVVYVVFPGLSVIEWGQVLIMCCARSHRHPEPFSCEITPRFPDVQAVLERELGIGA